ncbi:MAG: hypothetical protein WCS87_17920 [Methylococcaceae bacterium]
MTNFYIDFPNCPVSPRWEAFNVKDWQLLLVGTADGRKEVNCATASLLNYLSIIGIIKLTSENLEDAWRRIAIHQAIFGSFAKNNHTKKPLFLTRTDIERHIGIEVEGDNISFQEFCSKINSLKLETSLSELPSYIANGNASMLDLCLY